MGSVMPTTAYFGQSSSRLRLAVKAPSRLRRASAARASGYAIADVAITVARFKQGSGQPRFQVQRCRASPGGLYRGRGSPPILNRRIGDGPATPQRDRPAHAQRFPSTPLHLSGRHHLIYPCRICGRLYQPDLCNRTTAVANQQVRTSPVDLRHTACNSQRVLQ